MCSRSLRRALAAVDLSVDEELVVARDVLHAQPVEGNRPMPVCFVQDRAVLGHGTIGFRRRVHGAVIGFGVVNLPAGSGRSADQAFAGRSLRAVRAWCRVSQDFDAVHLSITAYLSSAGRPIQVDEKTASVIAGWNPDVTYWLTGVSLEPATRTSWALNETECWHINEVR